MTKMPIRRSNWAPDDAADITFRNPSLLSRTGTGLPSRPAVTIASQMLTGTNASDDATYP